MATPEIVMLLIAATGAFLGFVAIYGVVMRAEWMEALLRKNPIHHRVRTMAGNRFYTVLFGLMFLVFFSVMFFVVLMESLGIDLRIR